jgi:hypothetical protein
MLNTFGRENNILFNYSVKKDFNRKNVSTKVILEKVEKYFSTFCVY